MKFIYFILGVVFFIIAIIFIADIVNIVSNPEEYKDVYNFKEIPLSITSPSIVKYILSSSVLILCTLVSTCLSITAYKGKLNRVWLKLYWVVILVSLLYVGYSWYSWANTGYDVIN